MDFENQAATNSPLLLSLEEKDLKLLTAGKLGQRDHRKLWIMSILYMRDKMRTNIPVMEFVESLYVLAIELIVCSMV